MSRQRARSYQPETSSFLNPIYARFRSNNPRLVPHIKQSHNSLASFRTVVERTLVHVHANKPVGSLRVEIAGELHRIGQCFFSVVERILNAVTQRAVDRGNQLRPKRAADGVASQRQRQARHLLPPSPEI